MHKSHNIILLSQYHSFMTLTSHGSLQLSEPKNESHVRKWVQQQWCNVQEQYNGWKQQGDDYEMKERKNFKCSYELLSCFKCFMNCLHEWRESFSLVPFGPFFLKKDNTMCEGFVYFWHLLSSFKDGCNWAQSAH
jgi:hypothetical protein